MTVIPSAGMPKPATLPAVTERTLRNGLRVVAARRAGVPLVNAMLRIPSAGKPLTRVKARMLEGSMMLGTSSRSAVQLAGELQALGADLNVHADTDRIVLSGATLTTGLSGFFDIFAEVLCDATYPSREVAGEKERVRSDLAYMRSRPGARADEAMSRRLFGDHPYGAPLPAESALDRVGAASLRKSHAGRVVPKGSTLVMVGDLPPGKLIDAAERALIGWKGKPEGSPIRKASIDIRVGLELVDRPASVQTVLMLSGAAVRPGHEDEPALALANMIFGGYFSSRLVANIRERNGYTYSPRSQIQQRAAASTFTVQADVATNVTGPALLEIQYELGRIASLAVTDAELDSAKAYLIGTAAIALSTQAGVTAALTRLAAHNLPWTHVRDHGRAIAKVSAEEVRQAAARYLAPTALTAVAVGDASVVRSDLAALYPLS